MTPAILALFLMIGAPMLGASARDAAAPGPAPLAPEGDAVLNIDMSRFEVLGSVSAPVVVVEFSDFRCPACEKFSLTIMPNLTKEFIQPGKLKVLFVDFPMQGEESYTTVFESVHCAGKQGKYWQMHEKLWENVGAFGDRQLLDYAGKLGLDMGAFTKCLDSDEYRERVLNNARFANKLGLGARPTFFIGHKLPSAPAGSYKGRYVVGAHNYIVFKSMIERMLAGEESK